MTLTYAQQAVAAVDAAFVPVVSQAMLKVAQDIASEALATTNHAIRARLAQQVLCSPGSFAANFAQGVVADGITDKTATDVAIYNRISAIWNGYAGA